MKVLEAIMHYLQKNEWADEKQPLHIGEAMGCWVYYTAIAEEIPALDISLNTTTDAELKELLLEAKEIALSQKKILKDFMFKEGIPLSQTESLKPMSRTEDIPLGARSTDDEMANLVSIKAASGIVACATNLSQSIRTDLGLMWARFQSEKTMFATKLRMKMKKRGWLKVPPAYIPPGKR
ncbi:DUF3231 family protein [Marinicrinis sediminis]|uniref:DUF3231 family protein n=1 Tax=Marinicrinis sediminis TaxID=1652465 RepID=A0ABW5R8T1_9BACL